MDDRRRDKEISLGTSTMLGIFFVLTLLLAGFFGFGYSMGRKSAQVAAGTTDDSSSDGSGKDTFRTFKPAPGSAAIQAGPGFSSKDAAAANAAGGSGYGSVGAPLKLSGPQGKGASTTVVVPAVAAKPRDPDAGIVGDPPPAPVAAAPVKPGIIPVALGSAAARPAGPAPAGGGGTMVQVSAFTRQEDADVVVSALKRKGYNVFIRREPQDSFLHVQLGPYGSRKEAEAMKEKLSSDGFNAMVK